MPPSAQPFAVAPRAGLSVENPVGGAVTFKALGSATGGALTALEVVAAPGQGPPLHLHRDQDELMYTLDGRFRFRLGDELSDAPARSFVFVPRGTPHTWQNAGDAPARMLAAFTPAAPGFEDFFARYAELPPGDRDVASFARLAADTGAMDVIGPPLGA